MASNNTNTYKINVKWVNPNNNNQKPYLVVDNNNTPQTCNGTINDVLNSYSSGNLVCVSVEIHDDGNAIINNGLGVPVTLSLTPTATPTASTPVSPSVTPTASTPVSQPATPTASTPVSPTATPTVSTPATQTNLENTIQTEIIKVHNDSSAPAPAPGAPGAPGASAAAAAAAASATAPGDSTVANGTSRVRATSPGDESAVTNNTVKQQQKNQGQSGYVAEQTKSIENILRNHEQHIATNEYNVRIDKTYIDTARHAIDEITSFANKLDVDKVVDELDELDIDDNTINGGSISDQNTINTITKRCNAINKSIEKLKIQFYSHHNFIKLISLTPEELIEYFTMPDKNISLTNDLNNTLEDPINKITINELLQTTTTTSNYYKIKTVKNFLIIFIRLTFINISDFFMIKNKANDTKNQFYLKFDMNKMKNSTIKTKKFLNILGIESNYSYLYAPDFFDIVQTLFGDNADHMRYFEQEFNEYNNVFKEVIGRIQYIVEQSIGMPKQGDTSNTLLKVLLNTIDTDSNKSFVAGLDKLLKAKSDNNILTYIKFRGTVINNNARFCVKTNFSNVQNKQYYQNLFIKYNDDNIAYYPPDKNKKMPDNIFIDKLNNIKVSEYTRKYFLGKFTRVFTANLNNSDISQQMTEVLQKLRENKTVFIVGYGASGAGKTSTLIQLTQQVENKEVKEPGIIMHLCNMLGNEYPNLTLKTTEIFKSDKLKEHNTNNDDVIYLPNPPIQPIKFVYDNKKGFILANEYTHKNNHLYRNNNNLTKQFAANETLGSVLIHLIDVDRFVKATPNNPQSSRSHVLAYLTFTDKSGSNPINLVVGDFAGVENAFECGKPEVQTRFSNLKRNASDELFYKFASGSDPDPIGNHENVIDGNSINDAASIPFPIFDFNNITSFNRGTNNDNKELNNPLTGYSYAQFSVKLKNNVENLKKIIKIVKDTGFNENIKLLSDDFVAIKQNYEDYAKKVAVIKEPENAETVDKQIAELKQRINKLNEIDYDTRKTNINSINTDDLIISGADLKTLKNAFDILSQNTSNANLQNNLNLIINNFPLGLSTSNNTNEMRLNLIKEPLSSLISFVNTSDDTKYDYKLIGTLNNKPGNFFNFSENIKSFIQKIKKLLLKEVEDGNKNKQNELEKIQKQIDELTIKHNENTERSNLIHELENNNCPKIVEPFIIKIINLYFALFNKKLNIKLSESGCITTLINAFDKELADMFATPDNFLSTINEIKEVTNNINNETIKRSGNIKLICNTRTSEGQFINSTLKDLRQSIQQIVAYRNKDVLNITPDFITGCLNEYCPARNGCFKLPAATENIVDKSVIINDIAKTLFQENLTQVYDQLLVSVLCVVNLEKTANNPPPVPYVDINALKKMFYYKTMYKTPIEFLQLVEKTIGNLENYSDKLTEIIYSENTKNVKTALTTYMKFLETTDHNTIAEFKKDFENNLSTSGHKANFIKLFIESIDNSNAASTMGTLEFVDSVSKFNSVENICLNVVDEDRFIKEGYVNILNGKLEEPCETPNDNRTVVETPIAPDEKTSVAPVVENISDNNTLTKLNTLKNTIEAVKFIYNGVSSGNGIYSYTTNDKKENINFSELKTKYEKLNEAESNKYGNITIAFDNVNKLNISDEDLDKKLKKAEAAYNRSVESLTKVIGRISTQNNNTKNNKIGRGGKRSRKLYKR